MPTLKEHLEDLVLYAGIRAAVVLSRDGFLLELATAGESIDADAVSAAVAKNLVTANLVGTELSIGRVAHAIVEFDEGTVFTSPLSGDADLVIVADRNANLGNIRYQVKRRHGDLRRALF